jgi:hypothetical protein
MLMMEAPLVGGGIERLLRNRGGPPGTGGPEIILLTPLISSTNNNNKGGQQPNHQDVLAIDVAILDNDDAEEEEKRSSCGTLIQSWRNDLSRVETIVGHVVRHCLDHSSQFDILLFGAQWIVPMVLLSLLPIHATTAAAILHCQILWVRYAAVVTTTTTTTTTNGSHHGDDDDDSSNLQLKSPYLLYRNYYHRVLGCGLATLAVNLPTLLWILVHHDYLDYSEEAFGNDLTRAFVVVLANAVVFVLVRGGGRLEYYAAPTAGLVLIPLLPCLLIIYVLYTFQHHLCHITAMFNHLENEYYSGERFAAREASDQDRLEHQIATLATDPVVVTLQQRTMMMWTRRRVLNYSDLPRCLSVATLLIIIIYFAMSLLDIDDDIIIYEVAAN